MVPINVIFWMSEPNDKYRGKFIGMNEIYTTKFWSFMRKVNREMLFKNGRPKVDIRINHTHILDDPFEDPEGLKLRSRSPSPDPKRLFGSGTRVGADEVLDDDDDLTEQERKV